MPCFRPTIPTRIPWWLVAVLAGGLQVAAILPFWGARTRSRGFRSRSACSWPSSPASSAARTPGSSRRGSAGRSSSGSSRTRMFGRCPRSCPWAAAGGLAGLVTDRWRRARGESTVRANELTSLRTVSGEALLTLSPEGTIQTLERRRRAPLRPPRRRRHRRGGDRPRRARAASKSFSRSSSSAGRRAARPRSRCTAAATERRSPSRRRAAASATRTVEWSRSRSGSPTSASASRRASGSAPPRPSTARSSSACPLVTYSHPPGERKALRPAPQIEDLIGYSPAEWNAEPGLFERLLHPDDRERVLGRARGDRRGRGALPERVPAGHARRATSSGCATRRRRSATRAATSPTSRATCST